MGAGVEMPATVWGDFYGRKDGRLTPESCTDLAEWLEEHGELYLSIVAPEERAEEERTYRYTVRWLRWVAERCDGAYAQS